MKEKYVIEESIINFQPTPEFQLVWKKSVIGGELHIYKYEFNCKHDYAEDLNFALDTQKELNILKRAFSCGPHQMEHGEFSNTFVNKWIIKEGRDIMVFANNLSNVPISFKFLIEADVYVERV